MQHFVTSKLFKVIFTDFWFFLRNSVLERRTYFFWKKKYSFARWQTCYGVTVCLLSWHRRGKDSTNNLQTKCCLQWDKNTQPLTTKPFPNRVCKVSGCKMYMFCRSLDKTLHLVSKVPGYRSSIAGLCKYNYKNKKCKK